jgi:catalase
MRNLSIKNESKKLLQIKEIKEMKIDAIEAQISDFQKIINKGEINEYTVNIFIILCDKAIDYFYKNKDIKYKDYTKIKKDFLKIKNVENLLYSQETQIELFNRLPSLFKYYSK